MLIRIGVALSDVTKEKKLALKLTGISIVMKTEFDIALYSSSFNKLVNNFANIDIVIADLDVLQHNRSMLIDLYEKNSKCLPILIGANQEKVSDFLIIRPIEYVDSIESIDPENENEKIRKICDLYMRFVNAGFEKKSDNSVLYITTRQDSYAVAKDSILYCQSDLKYTVFVVDNGMIIRKLEKLQDVAEKYLWDFVRVHQSFLINPHKVKSIDKSTNEIILSNNMKIPFSRKYSADVRELFNN